MPPIEWTKGLDPTPLIAKIADSVSVGQDGALTFTGFEHFEHDAVLHSILSFPAELPESEAHRIVGAALSAALHRPPLTPVSFISEANRLHAQYVRRAISPYVLITTTSIRASAVLPAVHLRGCHVSLSRRPSTTVLTQRGRIELNALSSLHYEPPVNYMYARVTVRARSPFEAADNALDALDLARGLLNWGENRRTFMRFSSGISKPVNEIRLGPIHTLHRPDGRLATETWWYEPSFQASTFPFAVQQPLVNFQASAIQRLRRHPYQRLCEDAVIRYTRALDEGEPVTAFLKLWSVLELLTGSSHSYDTAIRRVSFLFQEHYYHLLVLNHLRRFRNATVHESATSQAIQTYLYQLKRYVDTLLTFHLTRGRRLVSLDRAIEFLDLPPDEVELARRARLFQSGRRYRMK